jgi:hypothetical protein
MRHTQARVIGSAEVPALCAITQELRRKSNRDGSLCMNVLFEWHTPTSRQLRSDEGRRFAVFVPLAPFSELGRVIKDPSSRGGERGRQAVTGKGPAHMF